MRARFSWVWVLLLSSVPLLFSQAGSNPPVLRVDEHKIQLFNGSPSRLELPVLNGTHHAVTAHVRVELLQPDDNIVAPKELESSIPTGDHFVSFEWPSSPFFDSVSATYWWRLRYSITPASGSDFPVLQGIVQLSEIMAHFLRIQVASLDHVQPGMKFPLRVHVDDPHTGKSQSGVHVEARWNLDDDQHKQLPPMRGRTDAHGNAVLLVKVPSDITDEPSIDITASRGPWVSSKSIEIRLGNRSKITVSTDKPIYQPGQVLHMRALVFGPDDHALAHATVKFNVSSEDSDDEFEVEAHTSEFGIAQADWELPRKVQLGDYKIRVSAEDKDGYGNAQVRISRYELPQFTVDPSTDKAFYLPGQQPKVEVKATYLFGQQVKRGTVRIVRDNGRHWNSDKKEYESDQEEVTQGELDSTGAFTTNLDVTDDFDDLDNADYERYKDLRYAAYVTDLSTNRTEQRHFTVRISKDPIHIYVIGGIYSRQQPLSCYVMTALPDGTPASVDVTVSLVQHEKDDDDHKSFQRFELGHLHTNKYGVGYFHAGAIPEKYLDADGSYSHAYLLFEAIDRHVGKASHEEAFLLAAIPYITITPAAALLREGENVIADIESSLPDQDLFVDLLSAEGVVSWQTIPLRHGHAHVEFAYDERFRDSLALVAYTPYLDQDQQIPIANAEVLFPEPQDLSLDVHLPRTTYKPGEPALAKFNVRSPDGSPAKGALGVVIYDKAVAERVRTDQEFGRYGFYFGDWPRYQTIANTTYRDLLNRKLTGPVPPDLELLAQVILHTGGTDFGISVEDEDFGDAPSQFRGELEKKLLYLTRALDFPTTLESAFPRDMEQLRKLLAQSGIDFDQLRDPWGMPFRASFSIAGSAYELQLLSNGPDKLPGTSDDFVVYTWQKPYFAPIGRAIDEVTEDYARRTGNYIRDFDTLAIELRSSRGIELAKLRDPWGNPYSFKFEVSGSGPIYLISVTSAGPDGVFGVPGKRSFDDIAEWTSGVHYFQKETRLLDSALLDHFLKTGKFPSNEDELLPVLQAAGLSPKSLVDPWGHPYHFVFSQSSRYADRVNVSNYSVFGGEAQRTTTSVPVTQKIGSIEVMVFGPSNDSSTGFQVAHFTQVLSEQCSQDVTPQPASSQQAPGAPGRGGFSRAGVEAPSTGSTGAISGTVTDPSGAIVAGAQITATDSYTGQQFTTTSDSSGLFTLRNLPPGQYRVLISARGFKASVIDAVPVTSSNLTTVDARLAVGEAAETVEVAAAAPALSTTAVQVSSTVRDSGTAKVQAEQQAFTPRVRRYFPETLIWQPELITDSSGKAQLKFAMADNITTWKMSVIASTANGKMGLAEKELRTFQPFFVDHEPPKVLTEGDQIQLPVVLRNYLNKPQQVEVKLEQAPWLSVLSAPQQQVEVPAGQDAIAQFSIKVDHSIHEGKERVTAASHDTGDAVERSIAVHPDGEDVAQTVAALLSSTNNSFKVEFPANAIPGSIDAELKIYPNLASHVLDSLNALVMRPAGCAEQITSIAFASVVVLQLLHKNGQDDPDAPGNPNAELARRARKYVADAYQQLSQLQNTNGGMPYWLNGEPDIAVTAYVLDFLAQASPFIKVDSSMIKNAEQFLEANQEADGGWLHRWHLVAPKLDANLTALVTRVLAETGRKLSDQEKIPGLPQTISKGMKFLEDRIAEWSDPYLVGQYSLAASMTGRAEYIARARTLLRQLAHDEGPATYWNLEANSSPFYSWGSAGRMETTGLAVRALALLPQAKDSSDNATLLNRGMLYLLNHKDRYGSWYSTQPTVSVLRGLVDALPAVGELSHPASTAEIFVNGKQAATVRLPGSTQISGPIVADLSSVLVPGGNEIEVRRQNDGSAIQAQLFSTHYIPWPVSQVGAKSSFKMGESRSLRLNVEFDHTRAEVGKAVQCTVEAERIGFAGYGMMLAEVGLPPGAEVDRDSLEHAKEGSEISEYDVLPDRVVFYVWPNAGGSKFSFSFKPRFAMNAAAAPSVLYDYYNPDAHATVAPARFVVQ